MGVGRSSSSTYRGRKAAGIQLREHSKLALLRSGGLDNVCTEDDLPAHMGSALGCAGVAGGSVQYDHRPVLGSKERMKRWGGWLVGLLNLLERYFEIYPNEVSCPHVAIVTL